MYKWPNRCSQLRYRASGIPTTGTLAPVQDYSESSLNSLWYELEFADVKRGNESKNQTKPQKYCVAIICMNMVSIRTQPGYWRW
jgi:hypothetical protein